MRTGQKHFRAGSTLQARRRRGAGTYTWRQTPPSQTGMDLVSENSRVQGWGTFVQAAGTEEEGRCSPGAHSRVPSSCSHCGPGFCPVASWAGSLSRLLSNCGYCSGLGSWEPAGCFPSGLTRVGLIGLRAVCLVWELLSICLSSWSRKSRPGPEGGRALFPPTTSCPCGVTVPRAPCYLGSGQPGGSLACQPPCPCTWRSGCRDRAPVRAYCDRHLKARPWWPQQARGSGSKRTELTVSAFEPWAAVTAVGILTGHAGASVLTGVF